jgi:hypothetical protein
VLGTALAGVTNLGLPLITAITAVVLPLVGLEAVGALLLTCTSLILLGDTCMTSSALLNIQGLPNIAGLLGIAGLPNVTELQRIAGLLRVAGLLPL